MIYLLIIIILVFPIGIFLKKKFSEMCVICLAVTTAWLIGLGYIVFFGANVEIIDTVALGILMGGSAVGSMYLFYRDETARRQIFKFPYLLTLFVIIYFLLIGVIQWSVVFLIVGLWIVFLIMYIFRKKYFKKWFQKIIECCKNW